MQTNHFNPHNFTSGAAMLTASVAGVLVTGFARGIADAQAISAARQAQTAHILAEVSALRAGALAASRVAEFDLAEALAEAEAAGTV